MPDDVVGRPKALHLRGPSASTMRAGPGRRRYESFDRFDPDFRICPNGDICRQRRHRSTSRAHESQWRSRKNKLVATLKGAPHDEATVQASLKTFTNAAEKMPALILPDSMTGGETTALPAIWENKADIDARLAKLSEGASAAARAT